MLNYYIYFLFRRSNAQLLHHDLQRLPSQAPGSHHHPNLHLDLCIPKNNNKKNIYNKKIILNTWLILYEKKVPKILNGMHRI